MRGRVDLVNDDPSGHEFRVNRRSMSSNEVWELERQAIVDHR